MPFVVRRAGSLQEPFRAGSARAQARQEVAPSRYFRWKGLLSRAGAAVMLVPALPLLGLLAALVRLTSKGPAFYRQTRVGLHGKTFELLKLRTMHHEAESKTGPVWTEPNDPRITGLGRLLRRVHLDELPQLFNVLCGEMTLIGPRPERPEFTQFLAKEISGYMDRYKVLPGITGLAQINLLPDTDVDSVRRKQVLDLEYIETATLAMDLRILCCTSLRLVGFPGWRVAKLLGLRRDPDPAVARRDEDAGRNDAPTTYCTALGRISHPSGGNGKAAPQRKDGVPAA